MKENFINISDQIQPEMIDGMEKFIKDIRERSLSFGFMIGLASKKGLSEELDEVSSIAGSLNSLITNESWLILKTKQMGDLLMIAKEELEVFYELRDLLNGCGFEIIMDGKGKKGLRNGSIDYFPGAVLD